MNISMLLFFAFPCDRGFGGSQRCTFLDVSFIENTWLYHLHII